MVGVRVGVSAVGMAGIALLSLSGFVPYKLAGTRAVLLKSKTLCRVLEPTE